MPAARTKSVGFNILCFVKKSIYRFPDRFGSRLSSRPQTPDSDETTSQPAVPDTTTGHSLCKFTLNNLFSKYDQIYITDLALQDPTLTKVANSSLREKILIFDHHQMSINNNLDRYEFSHIIAEDESGKKCATQLFYQYLITNNFLKETKAMDEFVSLTRLEDTWDWKKDQLNGSKAHDLAILFNILGITPYINTIIDKLKNHSEKLEYTEAELTKIVTKKEEYTKKLQNYYDSMIYLNDEFNNKFGILTADYEYRNEIAEYIKETRNHVLYRVTPIFEDDNLVASGVQLEAQSIEDDGEGVCFNVYCYNVQPGIIINYATGESREA